MKRETAIANSGRMRASGMRQVNSALLLEMIRGGGPVSRAELARQSGLTKPTVSSLVADLMERGIVVEDGSGEPDARGGKPPTMLRFDAGGGALAAAEIGSAQVRIWLADLDGNRIDTENCPIKPGRGAAHILEVLCKGVQEVLSRGRGRRRKLRCISVAAPGRVDAGAGTVLEAGNVFHWRNVEVRRIVEKRFGVATLVENDVNLAALGEMHAGLAGGVRNFVLIRLGTGIGAGLVLGGQLYQGTHWAAGEIAHMVFDRAAASDGAMDRGPLEHAIGSDQILERVSTAGTGAAGAGGEDLAAVLTEAMGRHDPVAARVLDELAEKLSIAVTDLAAVIDPELIVLSGDLFALVTDRIQELVGRVIPWPMRVELSALGSDAALIGALGAAKSLAHDLICDPGRNRI
jgi:predicted NBD/HSP70 family sugar kinase